MKINTVMCITTLITLVIFTWVLAYKFTLVNIHGNTNCIIWGEISYSISLSIIASYIFFVFNIYIPEHRKEKEKKARLNAIFMYYINSLNNISHSIKNQIITFDDYSSEEDNPDIYERMENIIIYTDMCIKKSNIKIDDARQLDSFWREEVRKKKKDVSLTTDSIILNFHDALSPNLITKLQELSSLFELSLTFDMTDFYDGKNCGNKKLYRYKADFKSMFDGIEHVTNELEKITKNAS